MALIHRVAPDAASGFVCRIIPADNGRDTYRYQAGPRGTVLLEGNGDLALAVAFNQYLRREEHVDYDWLAAGPLQLHLPLAPPAAPVQGSCLARERFFLNYCTYGYSLPWWGWDQWARFLDWMAMNGINRPLLQAGQEAVWLRVWQSYGLTDAQVRGYFTGPAHLPWHRMANIDRWGGPLESSYVFGQERLEQGILARARSLGMRPILSGFAGHVPAELAQLRPQAKITRLKPGWGGLPERFATSYLSPDDPLFADIQGRFLQEQEKLYGTDHLYAADPFNEMTPPSYDPAYLAGVGRAIFGGMVAADPQATWYQMTWTFTYDKHWTRPRLQAMLQSVPVGRLVLLDYVGEEHELYPQTDDCFGLPFIWNYLGNFGGGTHLAAPMHKVADRIHRALAVPNCAGVGSTLEGIGATPVIYDLTLEAPWHEGGAVDVDTWIRDYADQRAGRADPAVREAWSLLASRVFVDQARAIGTHGVVFQAVPDYGLKRGRTPDYSIPFRQADLVAALKRLLEAQPACRNSDGYCFDVVNFTRQALGDEGAEIYRRMQAAVAAKDADAFEREGRRFLALGHALDALLGTRREFLLGPWLRDARRWGSSPAEADAFEHNARQIITSWQRPGGYLTDYACRQWNGLMRDYYLPRWQKWIELTAASLKQGAPFPIRAYADWIDAESARWQSAHGEGYATAPHGDAIALAKTLVRRYLTE